MKKKIIFFNMFCCNYDILTRTLLGTVYGVNKFNETYRTCCSQKIVICCFESKNWLVHKWRPKLSVIIQNLFDPSRGQTPTSFTNDFLLR